MENENVIHIDENTFKIIMKCSPKFLTFDIKTYPHILNQYIPKHEWQQIGRDATKLVGDSYILRKQQEIIVVPGYLKITNYILNIVILICAILILIRLLFSNNSLVYFQIAMGLIALSVVTIIVTMVINYIRKFPEEKKLGFFIRQKMNAFCDELNQRYEHKKYLTFYFNDMQLFLECVIDKRKLY